MKKNSFFYLACVITLSAIIFTSCKSHEKCPAYSKTKTEVSHTDNQNA